MREPTEAYDLRYLWKCCSKPYKAKSQTLSRLFPRLAGAKVTGQGADKGLMPLRRFGGLQLVQHSHGR